MEGGEVLAAYHVSFYSYSIYIFHVALLNKGLSFNTVSLHILDRVPVASVDLKKTETNKIKMTTVHRLVKEPKMIGSPMAGNNRSEE